MVKNILFLFLWSLATLSCESAGTGTPVPIPDVEIDCTVANCTAATGSFEVVINVTRSGCAVDQIDLDPVITGTVNVICAGSSGCSGTVSSWRDNNGNTVTEVISSTYSICGWIDLDNSSIKNPNDAFADENLLISTSTLTLTDWGASNYRHTQTPKIR